MDALKAYILGLRDIRAYGSGVKEQSYKPKLADLLTTVGSKLKPSVTCILELQNVGAGNPDGGCYDKTQMQKGMAEPKQGQLPSRGAVEIKPTGEDAWVTADSEQVSRYWKRYQQVLVTNYRDFVLVGTDKFGRPIKLETYRLAENEKAFWQTPPEALLHAHGKRFEEFIKRVLLHPVPLNDPKDVAWFLASYARDALARVEAADHMGSYPLKQEHLPPLATLKESLEESLGLRFSGDKGNHFFRSTLVQTLFYGVFSAWVLWHKERPNREDRFSWKEAEWSLHVPMIRALFEQIAAPSKVGPLGLVEVMDWTEALLNRVDRPAFFSRFQEAEAVQYFYEPFLEAFDPDLRKELGVWYTPPEIVRYMVARVDAVLKRELELADGLGDERVVVLDPCCGTGAYLVEALRRIEATLREKEGTALAARGVKKAALSRVFGFELLPAPFVVSHLQLGLYLQSLGASLQDERNERAGVFLTNALTGWEPPKEPKKHLPFAELEEEREAAERVKREEPILVILGNPPYNGFAGVAIGEERTLTAAYRETRIAPKPQGQGLNELYVRFFRMAERRIAEASGRGVVCFISNYSWLDGLSHPGMREKYLEVFDKIWVDCLNGDKYKTGKVTPEGEPDPSVFSTEKNHEGIQVGTAIATLVRMSHHQPSQSILFRHLWGKMKLRQLENETSGAGKTKYDCITPLLALGFPFMPAQVGAGYLTWPLLTDLFPQSFPGIKTSRDDFLVDTDKERLEDRLVKYFDPCISDSSIKTQWPCIMTSTARFHAENVRDALRKRGLLKQNIVRYCYRPFDVRWLYWEPETKLLDEKREEYFPHVWDGNVWIEARQRIAKEFFDRGFFTTALADNFGNGLSNFFPLFLRDQAPSAVQSPGLDFTGDVLSMSISPNLSSSSIDYLNSLGATPEDLFFHTLAVLHAPAYREENAGALRQNWPRIPLPSSKNALVKSAVIGKQIATLLDTETEVPGVTSGVIRPELKVLAILTTVEPGENLDLAVTVGWGHKQGDGATMPGKGKILQRAGSNLLDVYLNDNTFFASVPEEVWNYTLGGYQVLKKWLSYREQNILGRPLNDDEARHFMNSARRISALLSLRAELDENYFKTRENAYPFNQHQDATKHRSKTSL